MWSTLTSHNDDYRAVLYRVRELMLGGILAPRSGMVSRLIAGTGAHSCMRAYVRTTRI